MLTMYLCSKNEVSRCRLSVVKLWLHVKSNYFEIILKLHQCFVLHWLWLRLKQNTEIISVCYCTRVAPDISGPGRNPAKFSYLAMAAGYEVGFYHLSMHLPHCVIGQEFIVLQIR